MRKSGGGKEEATSQSYWLLLCAGNIQHSLHIASPSVGTRGVNIRTYIKYVLDLVKFLLRPWPGVQFE